VRLIALLHDGSWYDASVEGWQERIAREIEDSATGETVSEIVYERYFSRCDELMVSENETVADVVAVAQRLLDGPPPAELASVRLRRTLAEATTVRDAGLRDGDIVLLVTERGTDEFAELRPVPTTAAMFEAIRSADEDPPVPAASVQERPPALWGALLYTDEDADLAAYVRRHFRSLNALIRTGLRVFVIERPGPAAPGQFWESALDQRETLVYGALGWLDSIPYDKSQAYEVARNLGVEEDQLPCLVVFDSPAREPKLVFPIGAASPQYFRTLFAMLRRATTSEGGVQAAYDSILTSLQRVDGDRARKEYTFSGYTVFVNRPIESSAPVVAGREGGEMAGDEFQFIGGSTTFINRPRDTVIRDFQTNYVEGSAEANRAALEALGQLLDLVLKSDQLPDANRAEAVATLHDVADKVKEGRPESAGTITRRLEQVKSIVTGAADIARPAGEMVATVLSLLRASGAL
jgi:hypothetical protein